MVQVSINVPKELLAERENTPDEFARQMQLAAAIYWYSRGDISQSVAAELAELNRQQFLEALANEQVDVFQVDFDDLERELQRG